MTSTSTDHPGIKKPLFLGHRGTRIHVPENTFVAFDLAAEQCDGFEFDVRRTADGVPIICHDEHYHKHKVAEHTYAQLHAVHPVHTLREVLERYQDKCYLNIELKDPGMETETLVLLNQFPVRKGVMVSSFLPQVIEGLAALRNKQHVPLGYICRNLKLLPKWKTLPLSHAVINHAIYSKQLQGELQDARIKMFIWTVNDAAEVQRFTELSVDGIISDDPHLGRKKS